MFYTLIFNSRSFHEYYNCTFYNINQIPHERRQNTVVGITYFILFIFFEGLYIPTVLVMKRKSFFRQSCYKIMFYLGIVDIIALYINAFLAGFFSLKGMVFCSSPTLVYVVGCFGLGVWIAQSDAGMILALNRCLSMYNENYAKKLFDGKRIWFWLGIPTFHSLALAFFTQPVVFNGLYSSWLFNPHAGYFEDYGVRYVNVLHTINNATVPIVLFICYGTFLLYFCRKTQNVTNSYNTETQKQIFLQVFIICGITGFTSVAAVLPQLFPVPEYMIFLGAYMWTIAHGCPAIVYITLNRSIRKNIKQSFTITRVGSTTNPT